MVRLLSGIALAAAAVASILFLPTLALRVLACTVSALAAHEYLKIVKADAAAIALVVVLCWLVSGGPEGDGLFLLMGPFLSIAALGWVAILVLFLGRPVHTAAAGIFAPIYIGAPLGMLAFVHSFRGSRATLLLIFTVVVSDSLQYYSGRMFGRHPLAPTISPKKTIEGAIGGGVGGTLFMALAGPWVFPEASRASLGLLGLAIVLLGIGGDLFESRLKRDAGVKDSAALIPGHGGVLDRIDALLFAAPAFFLYALVVAGLNAGSL